MPAKKYLSMVAGFVTEMTATVASAGAADDGKLVALGPTGTLDNSVLPTGIGADTQSITTSEALAAGDLVNVWNSSGAKVRKADASVSGKESHGFVLAAFASGAPATVYFEGNNTAVTGLTPGVQYLSATTAGQATSTPPSATGQVVQRVGFATAAANLNYQSQPPVVLA